MKYYINHASKILDIGAGKCGFLKFLKKIGYNSLTAVDPSIKVSEVSEGIEVVNFLDQLTNTDYDVIIISQLLEHIYDLKNFLDKVSKLCSNKTMIYAEVPDSDSYIYSYRVSFHFFDREHINHFTEHSLDNLFSNIQMTPVHKIKYEYVYINIGGLYAKNFSNHICCYEKSNTNNIIKYIRYSKYIDSQENFIVQNGNVVVWGFGSYFRRIYLNPKFPKNIEFIIDKNLANSGNFNGISFKDKSILNNIKDASLIITSALYSNEIYTEAVNIFYGEILIPFDNIKLSSCIY